MPILSDPLSLNRYSFVEGNPLEYRDPMGHDMVPGDQSGGSGMTAGVGSADEALVISQEAEQLAEEAATAAQEAAESAEHAAEEPAEAVKEKISGQPAETWTEPPSDPLQVGEIQYGPPDSFGRPSWVRARISSNTLHREGRSTQPMSPPGFVRRGGVVRGHLLARQLGGSSRRDGNFVTLTEGANRRMEDYEKLGHRGNVAGSDDRIHRQANLPG